MALLLLQNAVFAEDDFDDLGPQLVREDGMRSFKSMDELVLTSICKGHVWKGYGARDSSCMGKYMSYEMLVTNGHQDPYVNMSRLHVFFEVAKSDVDGVSTGDLRQYYRLLKFMLAKYSSYKTFLLKPGPLDCGGEVVMAWDSLSLLTSAEGKNVLLRPLQSKCSFTEYVIVPREKELIRPEES